MRGVPGCRPPSMADGGEASAAAFPQTGRRLLCAVITGASIATDFRFRGGRLASLTAQPPKAGAVGLSELDVQHAVDAHRLPDPRVRPILPAPIPCTRQRIAEAVQGAAEVKHRPHVGRLPQVCKPRRTVPHALKFDDLHGCSPHERFIGQGDDRSHNMVRQRRVETEPGSARSPTKQRPAAGRIKPPDCGGGASTTAAAAED